MLKPIVTGATFGLVAILFIIVSLQNIILSDGFGLAAFRQIDDYEIFSGIYGLYEHVAAGRWRAIFQYIPLAYGAGFWYLTGLLLYPFYKFGDPQVFVIAGRELATVFGFASLLLLYKISTVLTKCYITACTVVMLSALSAPFLTWTQKFHVNTLYLFFGLLAYYVLIKEDHLSRKSIIWSAVLLGFSSGLKLLGLLLAPLLIFSLLAKLYMEKESRVYTILRNYLLLAFGIGLTVLSPILTLFPFFMTELKFIIQTILHFRQLGTPLGPQMSSWSLFQQGILAPYLSGTLFTFLLLLFIYFTYKKYKAGQFLPLSLLAGFLPPLFAVCVLVRKAPIYTSTYFIGVGLLLPLLIWSIQCFKLKAWSIFLICLLLLGTDVFLRFEFIERELFANYRLSKQVKTIEAQATMASLRQIKYPLPKNRLVRILKDCTAVFPLNRFNTTLYERFSYWNLHSKKNIQWDYIVLNLKNWKPATRLPDGYIAREEKIRKNLISNNEFFNTKYETLFSDEGTMVFKIKYF